MAFRTGRHFFPIVMQRDLEGGGTNELSQLVGDLALNNQSTDKKEKSVLI